MSTALKGLYPAGPTETCHSTHCISKQACHGWLEQIVTVAVIAMSGNAGLSDIELLADKQGLLLHPGADGAADLPDGRCP